MPSPPRRSDANESPRHSEGVTSAAQPARDVEYDVPAEDATGSAAEYNVAPLDPTTLPPALVDGQPDDYILPESAPSPRTSGLAIHPTLASLSTNALVVGVSAITAADLRLPATNPESSELVVHCDGLPCPVRIASTGDSPYVTICDVVGSLHFFLSGAATHEDFANAPNPDAVTHAFHERTRGNRNLYRAGTIRFDYLPGPVVGLAVISSKDDAALKLVFCPRT